MCLAIQPDNLAIFLEMRSMREKRIWWRIPFSDGNGGNTIRINNLFVLLAWYNNRSFLLVGYAVVNNK